LAQAASLGRSGPRPKRRPPPPSSSAPQEPALPPHWQMPGAVGAIVAVRAHRQTGGYNVTPLSDADRRRHEQAWKEYRHKVKLNRLIAKYDTNNSKKLEKDQLVRLLTEIDSSTPPGTAPSEEEVNFVLKAADKAHDGCISADEVEDAMCVWMTYVEKRQEWDEKLKKYAKDGTGALTRDEVSEYLKDLNGGKDVKEHELEMVMKEADVNNTGTITKMELSKATAVWYGYVERKKNSCCTVS